MGTSYRFDCPSCGYSAEVSGGDDAGMIASTATIVCKACRRLYDAPTALAKEFGDRRDPVPLRCPRAEYHPIERWKARSLPALRHLHPPRRGDDPLGLIRRPSDTRPSTGATLDARLHLDHWRHSANVGRDDPEESYSQEKPRRM